MITITLIDYGAGNPASVIKACGAAGARVETARSPQDAAHARALLIPGVGHFASTARLDDAWRDVIRERLDAGAALLGICLGMQWLFDGSDEAPSLEGLRVFRGRCFRLDGDVKVPHVGWNTLVANRSSVRPTTARSRLLDGIAAESSMYFTHTFAAPLCDETIATTTHGSDFASVVEHGRVAGTQFHPEKSGAAGLKLLSNFIAMASEVR